MRLAFLAALLLAVPVLSSQADAGLTFSFKPYSRRSQGTGRSWGSVANRRGQVTPWHDHMPVERPPGTGWLKRIARTGVKTILGERAYLGLSGRARTNGRVEAWKQRWVYLVGQEGLRKYEIVESGGLVHGEGNGGYFEGLTTMRATSAEWNLSENVAEQHTATYEVYETDVRFDDAEQVLELATAYVIDHGFSVPLVGVARGADGTLLLVTSLPGRSVDPLSVDIRKLHPGERVRLRQSLRLIIKMYPQTWQGRAVLANDDGSLKLFTRGGPSGENPLPDGYDSLRPEDLRRTSPELHYLLYEPVPGA